MATRNGPPLGRAGNAALHIGLPALQSDQPIGCETGRGLLLATHQMSRPNGHCAPSLFDVLRSSHTDQALDSIPMREHLDQVVWTVVRVHVWIFVAFAFR